MGQVVPYARKTLLRGGLKLAIGVAGVAASLVLILLILGFRTGIYASITAYVDNSGADLFVGQEGATGVIASSSSISTDLRERIQSASGATSLAAVTLADVIFEHEERKTPVLVVGYEPGNRLGGPWRIGEGTEPADDSSEILFDRWLALENQIEVGDTVEILGEEMEVVGLTDGTSNWMSPYLFIPASTLDEILASSENVSFFLLKLPDRADRQRVRERIERRIGDVHAMDRGTLAEHDQELMAEVMETPLMVMLGISMVIGTAVLGLTSYTAALERMPEYAVLKAIGASPGNMRSWLLGEGVYRALLGYAVGGAASIGAARLIETLWPKFTIVITSNHFVLAAVVLVVMVAIGSLLPLRRVQHLDPAVVFRA